MKNFMQRVITGVIMLVFLMITIFLGKRTLFLLALFVTSVGFYELNHVLIKWNSKAIAHLALPAGIAVLVSFFMGRPDLALVALVFLLMASGVYVVLHPHLHAKNAIGSVFAVLYLFVPFGMLLQLPAAHWLYLVILASWGTDTFAYVFGMLFGKHKLIPSVSPKKTVEGAVGGSLSGAILTAVLFSYWNLPNPLLAALLVLVASVFAQFGDLFASKIKRNSGLKDYGRIFLGHGGVLDRFDSMLFVIPVLYAFSILISALGW